MGSGSEVTRSILTRIATLGALSFRFCPIRLAGPDRILLNANWMSLLAPTLRFSICIDQSKIYMSNALHCHCSWVFGGDLANPSVPTTNGMPTRNRRFQVPGGKAAMWARLYECPGLAAGPQWLWPMP